MRTLIATAFILATLAPTVADAAVTIGIGVHAPRHHVRYRPRHQVCSYHHHHRSCVWVR